MMQTFVNRLTFDLPRCRFYLRWFTFNLRGCRFYLQTFTFYLASATFFLVRFTVLLQAPTLALKIAASEQEDKSYCAGKRRAKINIF